jgi:ribonucleoside-diphosphate reductase alpha chain
VVRQLQGIGGGRTLGFGPNRVRSLADGVSQVLEGYLEGREERLKEEAEAESTQSSGSNGAIKHIANAPAVSDSKPAQLKIGDLCPECGEAAVVNEEGCRKCYACAYSEC